MSRSLRLAIRENVSARHALSYVGLLAIFRFFFDMAWETIVVVTAMLVLMESFDVASDARGVDERYLVAVIALLPLGIGMVLLWRGDDRYLGVVAVTVGGWLLLDTAYNLRHGLHPGDSTDEDISAADAMLLVQVGNLVAEELKAGPRTVPELADACDMTESRVRDALEVHERAGTVYSDGDQWVLDESRIGPWAFVRDNTHRLAARLLRPFRLFVPS